MVWNKTRNYLYASATIKGGVTALFRFKYNGDRMKPKLTNQKRIYTFENESGGHDLFPVYGEADKLWFTATSAVYKFDVSTETPTCEKVFDLPVGESGLAGSIVLAIMALPTIITVTEDAMRNCPRAMREASLALGASQWQTIYKVVIPFSISGITSGVVLGIGRAIGETMAVLMVTGNAAVIPTTILEPLRTIPATIAAELGEAPAGGPHYQALFLLGVVLFFITLIINFSVEYISSKGVKRSK